MDTGIHPSPQGATEGRVGKVLSGTIVIYEKWRHRGEGDRNSRGALPQLKEWHMLAFRGVPVSPAGRASINHRLVLFVKVCLHTLTSPPRHQRQAGHGRGDRDATRF